MKDVEILSEDQWHVDWRQERRLALLFEPSIEEDAWCGPLVEEFWLPHWRNRLDFVTQAADFCADEDKYGLRDLEKIVIQRRGGTAELEGSAFNLCELNEARELGLQHYSSHTPVFADIRLTATIFDHLRERLQSAAMERPEADRVLLACGFMAGDIAIPRPRPVKLHQKLPNAISIARKTPRIWFEIARASETKSRWVPPEMKSLGRWMAIER
jgi:hypothetical protein